MSPVMRFPRIKAEGEGQYHCISRVVAGLFIFGADLEGRLAAEKLLSIMRGLEAFTGVRVLEYVLMGNHFHLVCLVPEPGFIPQSEVLTRIGDYHGLKRLQELQKQIADFAEHPESTEQINRLLEPYRRRMNDYSIFVKELKGGFAQWYNRRHQRYGALWAERFKSVLLEGGRAVMTLAAYIDLNPVRAGLCKDPKDYRYCGYAEAVAKGTPQAYEGLRIILGLPKSTSVEEIGREYRQHLFMRGAIATEKNRPAFDPAKTEQVVEEQKGELTLQEQLRCRIRYFSDGVILGSCSFVEYHRQRLKQKIGYKRKSGPRAIKGLGQVTLWVFRNLRVRTFG